MKGKVALALIALAIVIALGLPIRERTERAEADLFETWRGGPAQAKVAAIEAYFARDKVGDVLPLADILRSDARWRTCPSAAPFAVPPSAHWPAMAKTLRYLREHLVPAFGPGARCFGLPRACRQPLFQGRESKPPPALRRARPHSGAADAALRADRKSLRPPCADGATPCRRSRYLQRSALLHRHRRLPPMGRGLSRRVLAMRSLPLIPGNFVAPQQRFC